MKLVIAEKPMLGRDIARAVCGVEVSESARLPISGNGYTVIACAGHLLELEEPEKLNADWGKPWRVEVLPIAPKPWLKKPAKDKGGLVKQIKELLDKCDSVVHAGDPDDEGQLIVDEVLDYLNYTGKVERVLVNDNIEKNIRVAFDDLQPNENTRALGNAALARQIADATFGFSETRLACCKLHANLSVGRVQTPTLGLVVQRDRDIANHTECFFYELWAMCDIGEFKGLSLKFVPNKELLGDEKHFYDTEVVERVKSSLNGLKCDFTIKQEQKSENAPLPFNLNELQKYLNKQYNFTGQKTLELTQALRDKYKAITYNRTDSQYLKTEHWEGAKEVLSIALANAGWSGVREQVDFSLKSAAFNDKNVTAHHGIIPQAATFDSKALTADERVVYEEIVRRYAAQFYPAFTYEQQIISTDISDGQLVATIKRDILGLSWKDLYAKEQDTNEQAVEETESNIEGVWFKGDSEQGSVEGTEVKNKKTSPPKPYTEGTLIGDMASISKYVSNPKIKQILKDKDDGKKGENGGIGTTATRASIIENLKQKGFLVEEKGKLRSTELAGKFYDLLPIDIRGADVTAAWWLIQNEIAAGKLTDVYAVQSSVVDVFNAHKDSAYNNVAGFSTKTVVGNCPICGQDVVATSKSYNCSSNKSEKQADGTYKTVAGCGFWLGQSVAGKKLSPKNISELLSGKGVTSKIVGFKSPKTGRSFNARLQLDKATGKIKFLFDS